MALQPLSVGDILMLSQQAWKIGRAFTKGAKGAPAEFREVESEANGLSDALKLTAETLHEDGSILERAEPETRTGVNAIIESAERTLGDLESFVDRYQVIRKRETNGGFVVEKSWSEVILANYKTFKWTTEGGTLTDLRNMLQMHTNTINLTMQALQSRSLARLEKAVIPLAENINSIHERVNGDLGAKIDDLHRIIMSIANSTPSLVARDRSLERPISRSANFLALEDENVNGSPPRAVQPPPPRTTTFAPVRQSALPDRSPRDSVQSTPYVYAHSRHQSDGKRAASVDLDFENGSPPDRQHSIGDTMVGSLDSQANSSFANSPYASSSYTNSSYLAPAKSPSSRREMTLVRRESSTLPSHFDSIDEDDAQPGSSRERQQSYELNMSPVSERTQRTTSWRSSNGQSILPPPALAPSSASMIAPATPSSVLSDYQRSRSDSHINGKASRPATSHSQKPPPLPPSPALSSLPAFEKALFRNAAILCDVRGTLVEYARPVPDEPDPRYNIEMVEMCKEVRICVIRKRENREHGGTRLCTSIWALSDDGVIRCQQKLSETTDTVPFCSYFQSEKVSLADAEMSLRLHGQSWTDHPEKDVKTNWVNYILASEKEAAAFQSAVFGRLLLGTFHTTKTTVIHQGFKGAFQLEEQFANIETLRLWEDDGVATPGAQGGVMALIHISSNFGEGWARWWMNSSKQAVRVKGEGTKFARLKGIDITVVKPGTDVSTAERLRRESAAATTALQRTETRDSTIAPRSTWAKGVPVKRVTGVKIEFKEDAERMGFLEAVERCQGRMLSLPDL